MNKAFTLIEVLIYVGITAIIGGFLIGIFLIISQIHQRESAATEVGSQLNFINQRIGQLVRESSNIEIETSVSTSTLKLRMKDPAKDPTCISLVNGVIKLAEGPGANPNECSTNLSDLTNNKVIVDFLNFKKFTAYPGHDAVSIDIQITYNSDSPKSRVTRNLTSAIARVSAATFDSSILPGSTSFEIGQQGSPWSRVYLSDGAASNPSYTFGNDTSLGIFKVADTSTIGFSTQGLERMRIDASGNIGIGTTTPAEKLTVAGNILGTGSLSLSSLTSGSILFAGANGILSQDNSNLYWNNTNKRLGIGTTTTAARLSIYGGGNSLLDLTASDDGPWHMRLIRSDVGKLWNFWVDGGGKLYFNNNINDVMIMTNDGNVGIGTMTPSTKLAVADLTSSQAGRTICSDANGNFYYFANNCVASSKRYKENINNSNLGLETLLQLRPVTFEYKKDYGAYDGTTHLGFIAEEVEKITPLLIDYKDEGSPSGVRYNELTAVLTKAIQEQQQQIEELKKINKNLQLEIEILKEKVK